jgi:hypothetical protein
MSRSIFIVGLVSLGAMLWQTAPARAALTVSATISSQQLSPTSYKYSLTLTNSPTSTVSASSLWFGWFPGYDLLPDAPTAFSAPAGWNGINAPDSFGVASAQFTTTTASLAPGQTLGGFTFTSPDSPTVLAGTSFFGAQIEQTYVYSVAPESGSVAAIVPTTVVPEPASLTMLLGTPVALLMRRKRR